MIRANSTNVNYDHDVAKLVDEYKKERLHSQASHVSKICPFGQHKESRQAGAEIEEVKYKTEPGKTMPGL